jgi:hypothetical protein
MIKTIAGLLRALMLEQAAELDKDEIVHGPSIGAMYEGLTRDLLDRTIPESLNVRVVEGFIKGVDDKLSRQIDAMIVTGEGRPVPHTGQFVWPIADVIAVFEVKKMLYGADLQDAFEKMHEVKRMSEAHIQSGVKVDPRHTMLAFAKTTGHYPPTITAVDALPHELNYIFRTMLADQLAPLRVILGYHGYADEYGLRKGLLSYLKDQGDFAPGFGPSSMPNLIVAGSSALLKMDGHPYTAPLSEGWWHVLTSNPENPLRLLIEQLWTRFGDRFGDIFPADNALELERLAPFLDARLAKQGTAVGWTYNYHPLSKKQMASTETLRWDPDAVETCEMVIQLKLAKFGSIDLRDEEFRTYVESEGLDPDALITDMVARRILAWIDPNTVRMIDSGILFAGFMPNGDGFSTTDTDRLSPWLNHELDKGKDN